MNPIVTKLMELQRVSELAELKRDHAITTKTRELTRAHGPEYACRELGIRLPEYVTRITGIPTEHRIHNAIETTNAAEEKYRESGLAIGPFPTLYHQLLTNARQKIASARDAQLAELDEQEEQVREHMRQRRTEAETVTTVLDAFRDIRQVMRQNDELSKIERKRQAYARDSLRLRGTSPLSPSQAKIFGRALYDNFQVDAALVGQWNEGNTVHEVYTAGAAVTGMVSSMGFIYTPRLYFKYEFDAQTGEAKNSASLPLSVPPPFSWPYAVVTLATLTLSNMALDLISAPMKSSLERRVLANAQAAWERNAENGSNGAVNA